MQKDIEIAKLNYTILQMNQMNPMNNQFNPMNMPIPNYPMFNPMFQGGNQMNMAGNPMNMAGNMNMVGNPMNMAVIPKETKKKKKIKRLNLTFKEGTHNDIHIQCTSNEKMESIINRFCEKLGCKKEEYKFIVNGNKVKMNLTIDKNGINNENQVIYAQKKDENDYIEEKNKKDIIEEKNDDSDYEYEYEFEDEDEDIDNKGICNDKIKDNVKILGEKIILKFNIDRLVVDIEIGMHNNFSDAAIKFGAKCRISTSKLKKNYKFLLYSKLLEADDRQTLKQLGIINGSKIEVIDSSKVIGA
jgi:hypothetical protein